MTFSAAPSVWNPDQYWLKAQSYVERAQEHGSNSSDYALWYAFAVEHLARAALCSIHPVLNADPQHLQSLLYGIDVIRTDRPKSLPIHAVYIRLGQLIEDFTKAHESFCGEMANRRNAELHSAERPFDGLKTESWLTRYYEVAEILCIATNHSLKELFGENEAEGAHKLIEASRSSGLAKVKKKLASHQVKFEQMSSDRKSELQAAATVSKRQTSETLATCPACGSDGRLGGKWFREGKPGYEDTDLRIEVTYLANTFECPVCTLELHGEEEIHFAGMQPTFTETEVTSLHEMFEAEFADEYMNM